jgi:hypothetical protein
VLKNHSPSPHLPAGASALPHLRRPLLLPPAFGLALLLLFLLQLGHFLPPLLHNLGMPE